MYNSHMKQPSLKPTPHPPPISTGPSESFKYIQTATHTHRHTKKKAPIYPFKYEHIYDKSN